VRTHCTSVDGFERQSLAMPNHPAYVLGMPALMTADDLLRIPDKHAELVRGVLVVREPPGLQHGRIASELAAALTPHVRAHALGRVYVESGFKLASNPDTVRGPDVSFIRKGRLPEPEPVGFPALAPDLVVEILSPDDRPGEILGKVGEYLSAGINLVWVIDPERRLARVYRADGTEEIVAADQSLQGEDVVPGFACPLANIL
jgi:Uma2 family endonuclease